VPPGAAICSVSAAPPIACGCVLQRESLTSQVRATKGTMQPQCYPESLHSQ